MRELEFLPSWYPMLRRKRRTLMLEAWIVGGVLTAVGLWLAVSARTVHAKEVELSSYQGQLEQVNYKLQKLNELQELERQMSEKAQLVSRLGLHVPTGRLINAIEQMMPKEMALRDLTMEFQRKSTKAQSALAASAGTETVDTQLAVKLDGVAPSDVAVGNFMIQLATIPRYNARTMSISDLQEYGRLMREYKVEFDIDLNDTRR